MPEQSQFHELIRRVRNRDEEAASELVRRYESAIRRVVRIHLRDARLRRVLDSTDICQSVLASFFVRVAAGQYDLDEPKQLVKLLVGIARNKLATQARREAADKRDYRRADAGGADPDALPGDGASPSRYAAAKELLQVVRERLTPARRAGDPRRAVKSAGKPWCNIRGG